MRPSYIDTIIVIGFLALAFGSPVLAWYTGDPLWLAGWGILLIRGIVG